MISDRTLQSGDRIIITPDPEQLRVLLTILPANGGQALRIPLTAREADDHVAILGRAADAVIQAVMA